LDFLKLPKGRNDFIKDIPANIIIDYAHNPEGFLLFLSSLQDFFDNLVVVFGCGGDRDRSKRPLMLNAALKYADKVIFTSDNSRNEEFSEILSDTIADNNSKSKIDVIEDRKAAIIHGTNLIKKDDCLVILGKGHEETQEKDGQILFFSDHEVVNEIYN
jgi:UDP-N-acetylmuramyl tripeptide synthase